MTAHWRDDKDIKKQLGGKMQLAICWSGSSHLNAPFEAKIKLFKSYCYPIYGCALWRHSYQNSIRKPTVVIVRHSSVLY